MKVLILANDSASFYHFRKELIAELLHPGSHLKERAEESACEVHIALPSGVFINELTELGCHFIDVQVDRRGTNPLNDSKLLCTYLGLLQSIKPDAVLTFTIKPNVYGGMACRLMGVPYFPNVTGLGTSIETSGVLQKISLMLYRLGINGAACTFFQNKTNMQFMLRQGARGKAQQLLPGSGVNLELHRYDAYPAESGQLSFLSIMRIMKDKGIEELLACAASIKKIHPHVTFSLAGTFDDERYREPVEQAHREGILNYLGFRKDIGELMKQQHCVIHPSYHEGMSNVLLEAAACGRPVIASSVPGCAETFDEGISGLGFQARDAEALTRCVENFISLPYAEKAAMGMAGRRKVESEFDRNIVISTYIHHIEQTTRTTTKHHETLR